MKRLIQAALLSLLTLFAAAAHAQAPAPERGPFPQAQLDAMLAPIALYPDALLSQVLMAATYPRDLDEAAAWARDHPDLRGQDAVRAAGNAPWDPSVLSLVAFPQVLGMLAERREWTEDLGQAYVEQPRQVMDTIQQLRARADAAGNLRSSQEILVGRRGDDYVIEPASPEIVYVPYYDPRYAYGTWWWPDYPPIWWNPWPGYRYAVGYGGFGWGYGVTLGSGFFFGAIDWPRRYLRYSHHRPWYFHHHHRFRTGDRWTHDRYRSWAGRDGRWRDANRDGTRDGRWRDGQRDGTRDGRWRDGQRDGTRDGRWRDGPRDPSWRDGTRSQATRQAPAVANETAPRAAPQYRNQYRQDAAPLERTLPADQQRAPVTERRYAPVAREPGVQSTPRAAQIQRQPVERSAPLERSAPVQRSAPAPVERSSPAQRSAPAPVERSAPQRSEPARQERERESSSNPAERGSRSSR